MYKLEMQRCLDIIIAKSRPIYNYIPSSDFIYLDFILTITVSQIAEKHFIGWCQREKRHGNRRGSWQWNLPNNWFCVNLAKRTLRADWK